MCVDAGKQRFSGADSNRGGVSRGVTSLFATEVEGYGKCIQKIQTFKVKLGNYPY
jgi:hypothetical protein